MTEPKKSGTCAYCGREGAVTRDHIPPRSFFPKPRPSDLITVPCCVDCHEGWSEDDEYFRAAVLSSAALWQAPGTVEVWNVLVRSLQKPTKQGFAKSFLSSIQDVEMETESGIYLGTAPVLKIQKERFDRVAQRIVRGLFFHEKGYPVPQGYLVLNIPHQFGIDHVLEVLKDVRIPPLRLVGDGRFAYTFRCTDEDPDSGVWISFFYRNLPFVGFTRAPKE